MRNTPLKIARLLSLTVIAALIACEGGNPLGDEPWASRLELNTENLEIRDGQRADLRATLFDASGRPIASPTTRYGFHWSVGDSSLVRIEGTGPEVKVTSQGVGTTTVSVRAVELWTSNNSNNTSTNGNNGNGGNGGGLGKSVLVRSKQQPTEMTIRSGDGQTGTVNTTLPLALEVLLVDRNGAPVPGYHVEFAAVDGAGELSAAAIESDTEGVAKTSWKLGTKAGSQTVRVTASDLETLHFTADASPGEASSFVVASGDAQFARPGSRLDAPIVARASDLHGNAVPGVSVTWKINSGGGSLSSVRTSTDANGQASAVWTLGTSTGNQSAVASAIGRNAAFTATAIDIASVKITSGKEKFVSLNESYTFVAQARNSSGSPVSGVTFTWTSSNPSIVTAAADGKMTAKSVGTVLVIAAAAGVADTMSVKVEQVPASVQLSNSSLSLSVGGSSQLQAVVKDAGGSTIQNGSVAWSSSAPAVASVSSGLVNALSTGSATIQAKSGDAAGQASVTVGAGGSVSTNGKAELPRVWVNTNWVEPTGQRIFVPAGGDLQAAINSAKRGDVIELQAGATFAGSFTLPPKSGSGWVVIRSTGTLPAPGTRMTPAQAGGLAKLVAERADQRALIAAPGASHYRIVGVEMTFANSVSKTNAVVDMQNGSSHIILDRAYVHGHDNLDLQRCVIMHAEHAAVIDSWLSKCHYKGADSQAIIVFNTNGPLKIVNNFLEGAGENIMLGGATPSANTLPADIEIRRNHFFKPQSWRLSDGSSRWTVKNLFEIKFGVRVLLEGNIFDGNWRDGQDGHAFNIKLSSAGSGNRVSDITVRYNIVRNTLNGLKISSPVDRIEVSNNIIIADDRAFSLYGASDLSLLNNTALHGGNIISSVASHARFVAQGNVWGSTGGYGVKGGGSEGTPTLDADFPGWMYQQNGHIGRQSSRYPSNNKFVSSLEEAGFMDASGGDLRLRSSSPFNGLGADVNKILEMTAGVR